MTNEIWWLAATNSSNSEYLTVTTNSFTSIQSTLYTSKLNMPLKGLLTSVIDIGGYGVPVWVLVGLVGVVFAVLVATIVFLMIKMREVTK